MREREANLFENVSEGNDGCVIFNQPHLRREGHNFGNSKQEMTLACLLNTKNKEDRIGPCSIARYYLEMIAIKQIL